MDNLQRNQLINSQENHRQNLRDQRKKHVPPSQDTKIPRIHRLIEDVVERTESFLSTNNELTTMTQVVIGNEIGENKSRLERMKTELGRLEAEEAEERDLERDDYVRVDYDDV